MKDVEKITNNLIPMVVNNLLVERGLMIFIQDCSKKELFF